MEAFPEGSLGEGWVPIIGEIAEAHLTAVLAGPGGAPVFLSSDGGDMTIARGIVDLIRAKPRRVVAAGQCASAALPILAAGSPAECLPLTKFLHHEPIIEGFDGNYAELCQQQEDMRNWFDWCNRWLAKRTKKTPRWWARLGASAGATFSSSAAQEWGLATMVKSL